MDFQLSQEQLMIRQMVRDFVAREVEPTAAERDEESRFDRAIFNKMAKLGMTGILFQETYGGINADDVSYMLVIEEIARVCASTAVMLSVHISLASSPIEKYGTEAQKQHYLRKLATGKLLGAFALSEAEAGSDVASMTMTAQKDSDDYILNGRKMWVTNGGVADLYIAFAKTDTDKSHHGITAFIVRKDTKGLSFGKEERKLGIRSSPTTELIFDHCRIPKENRLGEEGDGFKIAMTTLDGGRNGIAAQAVGIAQGAFDIALAYAKTRKQFGKPIIAHQAIAFKLADMATEIEAARLLTYRSAWRASQGLSHQKESAMSKLFASDVAMRVTTEAVQILGGAGYTKDYPAERLMRDAKITQIYEGTNEIQRLVIGRLLASESLLMGEDE